jgi:hypothetical protein
MVVDILTQGTNPFKETKAYFNGFIVVSIDDFFDDLFHGIVDGFFDRLVSGCIDGYAVGFDVGIVVDSMYALS